MQITHPLSRDQQLPHTQAKPVIHPCNLVSQQVTRLLYVPARLNG